ncbi:MAG TPA: PKD domain-containing protein [Propionicimonas sp.]|nr:PKD domain-containing protein [Propionicimonas sp.]
MSFLLAVAVAIGGATAWPPVMAADTGNSAPHPGRIVSDNPDGFTPHVMNGDVVTMTQVGNWIIVGGAFTTVRNAGSSTDIPRRNLFAFHAATGQVSTTFAPNPNSTVYKVQASPDGTSAYVGGNFTSVTSAGASVSVSRLYRVDVSTGNRISTFQPGSYNGQVRDISVTGNRLWIAGKFTHVHGQPQRALATLNATTGARDPYFNGVVGGAHLAGTVTNVLQIATNPSNNRLVAIGNFTTINGVFHEQIFVLDIGGPSYALANWYTTLFESNCSSNFETYMTDVEFSPDASFFVVSTTGAYGGATGSNAGTSGCDVVARFETNAAGTNIRPTWTNYTGGDTTWSVEVTDNVVYAGGHQRWQNNPTRGDAAGQGAVSRPGIAALNTLNGMPYSWNPTRTRGVGVKDMIATPEGLFVGSDTDTIGGETHRKVAFLPLASGDALAPIRPYTLPGDIFRVASGQSQLLRRGFNGTQVTSSSNAPNGTGWGTAVGAFMINGALYTAYGDGSVTRRTFDGTTYGPAVPVNTADLLVRQTDWHDIDVPSITSLFHDRGKIYFTRSGQNVLYNRAFEPESDVVGQQRFSTNAVTGVSYSTMRGAFVAGNKLYFADTSGTLWAADWNGSGPVAGTATALTTAGTGWSSRVMFFYQGVPLGDPVPPTASFTVSCALLNCAFDASASDDDGTITNYAWDFGDGATSNGASPTTSHTYASAGPRTVTLTVTDNDLLTGSTTRTANPSNTQSPVTFVAATSTTGNRLNHTVTIPPSTQAGDLLVLFFVANSTNPTYTGPAGWTQVETQSGDGTVGRAYRKIATAGDAGTPVTVTSSGYAKDVTTVVAYRGVDPGAPLSDSASQLQTSSTTTHSTPAVNAPDSQQWLVSYWADKSSATTTWTLPGGVSQRSTATGTSSGHISAVLGDSNGPVPSGPQGGLVATADSAGSSAITFSVLVNPS